MSRQAEQFFLAWARRSGGQKPTGRREAPPDDSACPPFNITIWIDGGHGARAPLPTRMKLSTADRSYFFTSGHSLASSGFAASSGEMVAISL
jgi:hypothetical protein